jgi:hypothetical protein
LNEEVRIKTVLLDALRDEMKGAKEIKISSSKDALRDEMM